MSWLFQPVLPASPLLTGVNNQGYINYWTGGFWDVKPVKVWNGSTWDIKPVKTWDGSTWNITNPQPTFLP